MTEYRKKDPINEGTKENPIKDFRSFYAEKNFGILVVIHDKVVNGDNFFIKELRS